MEKQTSNSRPKGTPGPKKTSSLFTFLVIPILLILSFLFYIYVLGDPSHFQGGNPANNPMPGDYFGIVYKGGYIVPLLITLLVMVIVFSIERFFTLAKARGKGNMFKFVTTIRHLIAKNEIDKAIQACDKQKGSVANVVKSGLQKYEQMGKAEGMEEGKKITAIQEEIEEATQFEMPMLEKNLVVISTITSISTLVGLLGTVLGMIKAFAALATAGAPDAVKLANGISEALVNTALGICAAALAVIAYNYFTTKIDKLTYNIDEIGYTIVQKFSSRSIEKGKESA